MSISVVQRSRFGTWRVLPFALIVAALPLGTGWTIWTDYRQVVGAAQARTLGLARALEQHVGRTLAEIDQAMKFLTTVYERRPEDFDLADEIYNIATLKGATHHIARFDADGIAANGTFGNVIRRVSVRGQEFFDVHARTPSTALYVGPAENDAVLGKRSIFLSRRLDRFDGNFAGVIAAALDPKFFESFLRSTGAGPSARFTVRRADGEVLATVPPPGPGVSYAAAGVANRSRPFGIVGKADPFDGIERITASRPLADHPVVVEFGIGEGEVLARWRTDSAKKVGVIAVVLALICALAWRLREQLRTLELTAAQLRLSESRYALAADGANGGLFEWNPNEDRLYVAPRAREIMGIAPGSPVLGVSSWLSQVRVEDRGPVYDALLRFVAASSPSFEAEFRVPCQDGRDRHVLATAAAERDSQGRATRIAGSFTDVTGHRMAEEALRRSQKMDAIGRLSGGIGHDFNNLLSIIIGNLDLVVERGALSAPIAGRVETARKAAFRGAALTKRLLAAARQLPAAKTVADINGVIRSMQDIVARALTTTIAVECHLADGLWPAEIDPGDLQDTILNLAINARDAMPNGGRLVIETENANLDADYARRNPGVAPGAYALIAISDNGIGMPKEILERAFEPFFTTKPAEKGTGLGLSMVYGFVKRSRGHISIYSEVGHGTTVRIYLPRSTGVEIAAPRHDDGRDAPLPRGAETILVVDDEADLRNLAVEYLTELGYRTVTADSGPRALEILAREPNIDLLFSDVLMPGGMTGFELAERAAERKPDLKVLLTSGFTRHQGADHACSPFADGMLAKPFRKTDLAHRVREVLAA